MDRTIDFLCLRRRLYRHLYRHPDPSSSFSFSFRRILSLDHHPHRHLEEPLLNRPCPMHLDSSSFSFSFQNFHDQYHHLQRLLFPLHLQLPSLPRNQQPSSFSSFSFRRTPSLNRHHPSLLLLLFLRHCRLGFPFLRQDRKSSSSSFSFSKKDQILHLLQPFLLAFLIQSRVYFQNLSVNV